LKKLLFLFIFLSAYAYNVSVSILPQKFIIDNISQNTINVNVMLPKGANPALYSPTAKQLLNLKKSKIYFTIEVPFEKAWIHKFKAINPKMKIISFAKFIHKKSSNPHIWLDPILLIKQAKVVYLSLLQMNPEKKDFYYKNYIQFKNKCLEIDAKIRKLLSNLKNRKFIIFHPNLYYFAKRYNLIEIAMQNKGKEPSFKYLLKIIKTAKQNNIKIIFTSPEFSKKSAKFLASKIDAKVIDFSALEYDIFKNLLKVSQILYDYN